MARADVYVADNAANMQAGTQGPAEASDILLGDDAWRAV